jgi:hypothetical protein
MVSPKITEVSETAAGGLYVVAEYRHDESDVEPFLVQDFHWKAVPGTRSGRLALDEYGRVTIRGKKAWPTVDVDGVRVPHPQLDQAATTSGKPDRESLKDVIRLKVVGLVDRHDLDGPAPKISGNRSASAESGTARVRPRAGTVLRGVSDDLANEVVVVGTKQDIGKRQTLRQRPVRPNIGE